MSLLVVERQAQLKYNGDGSLTLYVQASAPPDADRGNWLPAPTDGDFTLYVRTYWPQTAAIDGSWTPPPVVSAEVRFGSKSSPSNQAKEELGQ